MSMQQIETINKKTLSTKFLGKTKSKQFRYSIGGAVPSGLKYHSHYLNNGLIVYMTGEEHNKASKVIVPFNKLSIEDDKQKYQILSQNTNFVNPIKSSKQIPLPVDYDNGFFVRFFAKKVGEKVPFEIKRNFMNLDSLYTYYAITWKLRGSRIGAMRANREAVFLADKKFRGLKVLIDNYIKYYGGR
jgi:hypothetical protein